VLDFCYTTFLPIYVEVKGAETVLIILICGLFYF